MAKYTVAVCDDEKEDLSFIVRKITEYDTHQLFEIKTYTDGELLFDELKSQKTSIDLLLLDIEMPSNGFQLARTLQALPKHPMVIFVTRQHEYAVQGYGIAFRYLTKPLNDLLFKSAMDAATQELASRRFLVECDGGTLSLETANIYYIESYGHTILVHSKGKDFQLRMNIQDAAKQLPKRCFTAPHRCYLVNMEHILYAADKDFPDYMVFFMAVLLFVNIMIVFYVEALRKNEKEKYLAELTEQHYHLQIEYYQQLLEKQQETKALWHDIKKYTAAMQAVAAQNDSEQLRQIAQAAEDAYERVKDISAVGNPVVDALLNQYLRSAKENQIQVLLDITIPEVLAISTLLLSVVIGNTFDNAIEACRLIAPEKRVIHLQLRKQNRILFYSIENPYIDAVTQLRVGKHHGYGLKNVERAVNQNNGNFQLEKVDGNFIVQIRLNCEN